MNRQMLIENIKMAINSIRNNKTRSFLTMLGIIIGIMAISTIFAIGDIAASYLIKAIQGQDADLIFAQYYQENPLERGSGLDPLTPRSKDMEYLEGMENVEKAIYLKGTQSEISNENAYLQASTYFCDLNVFSFYDTRLRAGRLFSQREIDSGENVLVLSLLAAEKFDEKNPYNLIGQRLDINGDSFQVIGIIDELADVFGMKNPEAYAPLSSFNFKEDMKSAPVQSNFGFLVKDPTKMADTSLEITNYLNNSLLTQDGGEFITVDSNMIEKTIKQVTGIISSLISAVAAISLLVGGVGVMNIMLVSVTERTKEIGIRKAMGASNKNIRTQFLIESSSICFLGGLIGLLISRLIISIIGNIVGYPASLNIKASLIALLFSTAIGIIFGLSPAKRAAKLDPVEAMRYE